MRDVANQLTDDNAVLFMSTGSFSFESRKLATSICLLFLVGMKRSPPILEGVCFLFLPTIYKNTPVVSIYRGKATASVSLKVHDCSGHTLPGVLLGVFDELSDTLTDLPGDKPFKADVFDELAFLCHLAMGAFVIGISSFKILWMSFSNPN